MNSHEPVADRVPGYDEIVARNGITLLQSLGDLTVRNGDIAMTRWGDLMLNDADYSAFVRFVQFWRYNFPTLQTLFCAVFDKESDVAPKKDVDALGHRQWDPALGLLQGLDVDSYHDAIERDAARKEARGVYAGSITLVISRALMTFRTDISATLDDWKAAGPRTHGHSVGAMLEAAGNNMRHGDEWLTVVTPTAQQMKSVSILSNVLGEPIPSNGSIRAFARDISPEILAIISGGDFLTLEANVFAFADDLLARRRSRAPSS